MLSRSPRPTRPAGFIEPCLPTLAREVPGGPLWVHEIKHDGYRFVCRREGERPSFPGRDPMLPMTTRQFSRAVHTAAAILRS